MAKLRPKVPILAVCSDIRVARWLALVWGVYPIIKQPHTGEFDISVEIDKVCKTVCDMGFADPASEMLTVTAGLPWGAKGTTNVIRVTSAAGTGFWFDKEGKLKQYEHGHDASTK
jgi:pyruvate kinase